ncbi:helix-turn-helix domain-containing protein [Marinomonas transparens]|uniref:Helix-turn-helix domain-containing protein n=1 Tax=Marinomonas transparens TaxID=2795388 RepID=A0A934MZK5_9GAMM|nr:helix-turn-helix domain-containing protein [Marinomonas transparens]MBJ7537640.1 helix-turn-helix domain-containing protein [Marinomonas transparens]
MPKSPEPIRIVTFLYENLCLFEFSCVAEIFGLERPELPHKIYDFETVSLDNQPVKTQFGGVMSPSLSISDIRPSDTLLIPGWHSVKAPVDDDFLDFLRDFNGRGGRIVTICSGAYPVASAGLLDGRGLATHWRYVEGFIEQFPDVEVYADKLYVDCGDIITSAGSAAGLDVCLHLIRKDYGSKIANVVARRLVIPPVREGNQAQFIAQPVAVRSGSSIAPVLDLVRQDVRISYSVEDMANIANMSERTFIRKFKSATGQTPKAWVINERMLLALQLLETTRLSVESITEKVGFESTTAFRHHFREKYKTTPSAFRDKFCIADDMEVGSTSYL